MEKLPKDKWSKEFQSAYVRAVNVKLIESLLATLHGWNDRKRACSVNRFMAITNESKSWLTKFKKELINNGMVKKSAKTHYPRLRMTSDFLGLPPWFLFDSEKNPIIEHLFKHNPTPFSNLISDYHIQNLLIMERYLEQCLLTKEEYHQSQAEIKKIISLIRKNERELKEDDLKHSDGYLRGTISGLVSKLKGQNEPYELTTTVDFPADSGMWTTGILRIVQGPLPSKDKESKQHFWQSAWLTFRTDSDSFKYYKEQIHLALSKISELFNLSPMEIIVTEQKTTSAIYSWHSLRFKEIPQDIVEMIKQKISSAHLSINCDAFATFETSSVSPQFTSTPTFTSQDEFIPFLTWLNLDVPKKIRQPIARDHLNPIKQFARRTNTLPLLIDLGYLQHLDRLQFHHPLSRNTEDPRWFCRLDISGDTPRVRWEFNQQLYSISKLTSEVLNELDLSYDDEHLNGNQYWVKEGEGKNLYTIAESHTRSMKANRESLSLFDME